MGQLWLAGVIPGLMMASLFIIYIIVRCRINPTLGPVLRLKSATFRAPKSCACLRAGLLPVGIFAVMMVPFVNGWTSLVESSAIGAIAAFAAAVLKGRMTREVFENSVRNTLGITVCSCGSFSQPSPLARCLTGWALSKAIESAVHRTLEPEPLDDPYPDAA